jgi:hypothetical protein
MAIELVGERLLRLQPLTYVPEGDEVMVGRPDTGSYGVFPPAGAELLRRLQAGTTVAAGARWWHEETGESLDVEDFLETVESLGFVVPDDQQPTPQVEVRWRGLGRALFAPAAWLIYGVLIAAGLVAMALDPGLRPSYRNFFFTEHIALIPIALALGQFPLLLLHEGYHALAARRRGLPSTLGIGRRFYYLVAETRLDSLYSLPRRQRYLPFFAGALIDAVGVGVLTVIAAAGKHWGAPPWAVGLALAFALSGVLRIVWQAMFYLETDVYFAINTASRCTDLHGAAAHRLRTRLARLRRRDLATGWGTAEDWSEHDHAAARWYAPLMVAGYGLSATTLLLVGLPAGWRFWGTVVHRLFGPERQSAANIADTLVFVALSLTELGLLAYVTVRDRRSRSATTAAEQPAPADQPAPASTSQHQPSSQHPA